jgi:MFS transporter, ACS family, D-galactonate transporter
MPKARWAMITLCFLAVAISYVDRINLAIAAPYIKNELGVSDANMGLVLGAFFWTYALMQIPSGWILDRIGARAGLAIAVGWWSAFTMATGLARNLAVMFGCRLALGAGEAGAFPGSVKVVHSWFPQSERGIASGIFDAGPRAGTAMALPLVTWAIAVWSWQASFFVTGLLGFVWVAFWLLIYREPEHSRFLSKEQLIRLQEARGKKTERSKQSVPWYSLFQYRTIWGMMIGFFCFNFVNYFFITWFPTYLVQAKGFSLAQLGTLGAVPALLSVPGSILGGWASDELYRHGWSLTAARKTCLAGGMLLASTITLTVFTSNIYLTLLLFSVAYASLAFAASSIWALAADVAPEAGLVATIAGVQNFASNLSGVVTTASTGFLLAISGGSFDVPLTVAGAVCVVGACVYLFVVGRVEPLDTTRGGERAAAHLPFGRVGE